MYIYISLCIVCILLYGSMRAHLVGYFIEHVIFISHSSIYISLPGKVLHPTVASDVIAAVKFAKKHGLEISVKNSGHSYTSSSTKANTLLLNMRRYTKYAPDGITNCDNVADYQEGDNDDDLSDQPCSLSQAKGKPGVIRVSGGENFGALYGAVHDYNLKNYPTAFKYHVVGGGAATVSPSK